MNTIKRRILSEGTWGFAVNDCPTCENTQLWAVGPCPELRMPHSQNGAGNASYAGARIRCKAFSTVLGT